MPHSGRLNKNKKNRPSSGHFLLIKNNTDIIETRRSYKNLTNRIHEQWEPSNHDLNTGIYQRGKKTPDPNASVDSWLTFSGSQTEEAEGIVDAFAGKYGRREKTCLWRLRTTKVQKSLRIRTD